MKIISLSAENIKRLKAVEITPDGTMQIIGGRNAQGKTSVLDAIWLALGGGSASKSTSKPVRDGEEVARVRLDLGDLIVTREWTGDKSKLAVTSADGARYSSPQSMLDELVGKLSFDPLEFTRLSPREQRDALLDLVDLDVDMDALDAQRKRLFDQRTEIGRQGKAVGNAQVDDSLPDTEQSAVELVRMIKARNERNAEISAAQRDAQSMADHIADLAHEIQELQNQLADTKARAKASNECVKHLGDVQPTDDLEDQLAGVEESNARIRANNQAKAQRDHKTQLRDEYNHLTEQIESCDSRKVTAIKAAKFPIDGLGFDEHGVTYKGVPFSQASSAEQIRVSLAMAMALNPKLRVIRILDGSLLDADNLALIKKMATAGDMQVWIERVGNADEGAVIIEDGEIAQPTKEAA